MTKRETHKAKIDRKKVQRQQQTNQDLTVTWFQTDHSDFVSMDCVLCGTEMTSIYETHNPYPLSVEGRCCSTCNGKVISARLRMAKEAA